MTTSLRPHCNQAEVAREYFDGTPDVVRCESCGLPTENPDEQPATPALHAKLLFIDDDQMLLGLSRIFAEMHGFQFFSATDGLSGIALAKQERPDLIILDVMMPGIDGFEVCRRMREEPELKDIPILIFTALRDPTITAQGMKAGATLTMTKLLEPPKFLATINTLLTLRSHPPTASAETLLAKARNSIFIRPS
jgi:DNA-binding response OmpR family regulator